MKNQHIFLHNDWQLAQCSYCKGNMFIRKVWKQFPHKECMSCKSSSDSKTTQNVKTWQRSFVTNPVIVTDFD